LRFFCSYLSYLLIARYFSYIALLILDLLYQLLLLFQLVLTGSLLFALLLLHFGLPLVDQHLPLKFPLLLEHFLCLLLVAYQEGVVGGVDRVNIVVRTVSLVSVVAALVELSLNSVPK
jgi:hypothetical protein